MEERLGKKCQGAARGGEGEEGSKLQSKSFQINIKWLNMFSFFSSFFKCLLLLDLTT